MLNDEDKCTLWLLWMGPPKQECKDPTEVIYLQFIISVHMYSRDIRPLGYEFKVSKVSKMISIVYNLQYSILSSTLKGAYSCS